MPFGLTNAPATCQQFVNDTLREYLDVFFVCYLDDILIYSNDLNTHHTQVRQVLEKLVEAGLYIKPEKCEFNTTKTSFLCFIISEKGIEMDHEKASAIMDWEIPTTRRDVQCFSGSANFYRRFFEGYSRLCLPLFKLLRTTDADKTEQPDTNPGKPNRTPIEWTLPCQKVFNQIKSRL